jgi:2-dehydro-3-deoxyphosphogluconate aldolase/(4S)-4-hydroxy-2-oxoglutarate aldolase
MTGADSAVAALEQAGVVPVAVVDDGEQAKRLLDALESGGLPVIEITLRTAAGAEALRAVVRSHPHAVVGAGTVRTLEEAERVLDAGARFVVSPGTYPELVARCAAAGVPALPGACTPTEVDVAVRAGATLVKLFPAEVAGGIPLLRALAGPYRDVRFVPTGGVDASNLRAYAALPNVAACGGSWLVAPALVRAGEFRRIESLAREAVRIVREARSG